MSYVSPRACGDCTACCEGSLEGEAYGHRFFPDTPCHFLQDKKCTIYLGRPHTCKNYYCAWVQGLFPEWMQPNLSGILISVELDAERKQF